MRDEALEHFVHTPAESASGYVRFAKETQADPGVTFGCDLDNTVIPVHKGRVMCLLARSGNGKTTIGASLVRRVAAQIAANGEQDKFYTAHITWEQPAEEIEALYQPLEGGYNVTDVAWGRVPIGEVIRASARRQQLPVWVFGDSIYGTDVDTPPMTLEYVFEAIQGVRDKWNLWPKLLFFDYIQDIPVPDERDRYNQVSTAMRKVKRLAYQLKTPVILGVQANWRTDDRQNPMPTERDTEWSAVIGQKTDAMLALWRPIKSYHPAEKPYINIANREYANTDNLMVIKLLKQRGDTSTGIWALDFNPATLTLSDMR